MSYKTMKQSQDWRKSYDWTDPEDHPVQVEKLENDEFQPKVLKDQVLRLYKKPKMKSLKPGGRKIKFLGVIDTGGKPLFPINKEVK